MIQNFSLWRMILLICVCVFPFVFLICSIIVNFTSLLKSCPSPWKCLHAGMKSFVGWYALVLWLFNCMLKAVSHLPTYCVLHFLYSMLLLLQVFVGCFLDLDVFVSSINKFRCLLEWTFQFLVNLEEILMFVKCVSYSWQSLVICCYKQELISFFLVCLCMKRDQIFLWNWYI